MERLKWKNSRQALSVFYKATSSSTSESVAVNLYEKPFFNSLVIKICFFKFAMAAAFLSLSSGLVNLQ